MVISQPCGFHGGGGVGGRGAELVEKGHQEDSGALETF